MKALDKLYDAYMDNDSLNLLHEGIWLYDWGFKGTGTDKRHTLY